MGLVLIIFNYYKIKAKKNLSYISNIGLFTQISVDFSLGVYLFLCSLVNTITYSSHEPSNSLRLGLSITANAIYCLTTLVLITYYKDVIFAMTFVVIEVGYLSNSESIEYGEIITAIVNMSLIFISIVTAIFQYGKLTFGYEEDLYMDILLENNNSKKISNKASVDI